MTKWKRVHIVIKELDYRGGVNRKVYTFIRDTIGHLHNYLSKWILGSWWKEFSTVKLQIICTWSRSEFISDMTIISVCLCGKPDVILMQINSVTIKNYVTHFNAVLLGNLIVGNWRVDLKS